MKSSRSLKHTWKDQTFILFTDLNPFKLALLLERGKVKTTAKSGDIAAMDVVIPAGNTGQPPGPVISQLNAVGLPTRIESGSVWISKDTLVVRKGEVINERLAGTSQNSESKQLNWAYPCVQSSTTA
jgi:large subunit ribosomal protein L10